MIKAGNKFCKILFCRIPEPDDGILRDIEILGMSRLSNGGSLRLRGFDNVVS